MNIESYIQEIQVHLIHNHARILKYFELSESEKSFLPQDGGWSIHQILEHISLTSHFLLILIKKGVRKALRNLDKLSLEEELASFDFDLQKFERIGRLYAFEWIRPEHMEPIGEKNEEEIKAILIYQVRACLQYLEELNRGEGLLYHTTMTVDNLGKLNVYEYIYFLSKHAERHISQIEENLREYSTKKGKN